MKAAIIVAGLLVFAGSAQAKVTPFDGTRQAKEVDVVSLVTGPVAAELERNYFQAPAQSDSKPAATTQGLDSPGRCTVTSFVFAKVSLAQACY